MKLTLTLAVAVAALGGALLATVLRDDEDTDDERARVVVQEQPTAPVQPEPTAQSTQPARRDRSSGNQAAAPRFLDPEDRPIGRRELGRVHDAAVRGAGNGTVTDIDRSDDLGAAYEVELVQNGQEVNVRLDRNLDLVATDYGD